jgi:methylmalonyl-CoA/ethylmalonyl-CoA epimerase
VKTPIREKDSVMAMQLCFVTEDIEQSMAFFGAIVAKDVPEIGNEPPIELARPRYLGEHAEFGFRIASMVWRGTIIEFIQPDHRPSAWREFLDRNGPGIHHVGFAVPDIDATVESLAEIGVPLLQDGYFPGGRYAYSNSEPQLGAVIELLQFDDPESIAEDMR